jgi:hypothetical protein
MHFQALLAALGDKKRPRHGNEIAHIEHGTPKGEVAQHVLFHDRLDLSRFVLDVGKDDLSLIAQTADAARKRDLFARRRKRVKILECMRDLERPLHPRRIRIDPRRPDRIQLLAPLLHDLIYHWHCLMIPRPRHFENLFYITKIT